MMPYFLQSISKWAIKKWGGRTEAFTNGLAIVVAISVIGLAICSVTTVIHNSGTPEQYCTTLLGEHTSCEDDDTTVTAS